MDGIFGYIILQKYILSMCSKRDGVDRYDHVTRVLWGWP